MKLANQLVTEIKENIECICLKSLFDSLKENQNDDEVLTHYGFLIKVENNSNGDCYYDLYKNCPGLRLCCNGEQCKIVEKTNNYVKLIDVENIDNEELEGIDTTFQLSIKEFELATFKNNSEEM